MLHGPVTRKAADQVASLGDGGDRLCRNEEDLAARGRGRQSDPPLLENGIARRQREVAHGGDEADENS